MKPINIFLIIVVGIVIGAMMQNYHYTGSPLLHSMEGK